MTVTQIREPDLVAAFGFPDGAARARAVLALGGSDGGIPEYFIRLLVAEGLACLALAYFISGGDDRMWPAERMCRMVVDRLRRTGRDRVARHLNFPEAGHALFPFEASGRTEVAASMPFDFGGRAEAASAAHASAWPEVLRHLQ
jgi:hypothetical protein